MLRWIFMGPGLTLWIACSAAAAPLEVAGWVRSEHGDAVVGARVEISPLLSNYAWTRSVLSGPRLARPLVTQPLGPRAAGPLATAEVDRAGRFVIAAPSAGVWTLAVTAPGFVPMRYAPLPLAEPVELPPLTLLRDAGAEVRVTDSAGQPLAGIAVMAESGSAALWRAATAGGWRSGARLGRSDDRGRLQLPRLPGEHLRISALAPGTLALASAEGQGRTDLVLSRAGAERIVRVREPGGEPAAEVVVAVGEIAWPAGQTAADGRVVLSGALSESVVLHLFTADGRRQRHELPAGHRGPLELTLVAAARVPGRALARSDRRPLADVLVWPTHDPGRFSLSAGDGGFGLSTSAGESFWIRLQARGYSPRGYRVRAPGTSPRPITVALAAAASTGGEVVDPAGKPLGHVTLEANLLEPGTWETVVRDPSAQRAVSDTRGRFTLSGLALGSAYELVASKPGYTGSRTRLYVPTRGSSLDASRIVLRRARSAHGRVLDGVDRPVAGAEVRLVPTGKDGQAPEPVPVLTDRAGRFEVAALPGPRFDLRVRRRGFASAVVRGLAAPAGAEPASVDLGTLWLMPAAAIAGRVFDPEGEPIPEAGIWLLDEGKRLEGRPPREEPDARTEAAGRFAIGDLVPGEMADLWISRPGYLPVRVPGVEAPGVDSPGVDAPGVEPLTIVLRPASEVAGWVIDDTGQPLTGARIRWRRPEPPPGTVGVGLARWEAERVTRTDADGAFVLTDLPPGPAELSAELEGLRSGRATRLELVPGSRIEGIELVLRHGTAIEGWVRSEHGEPVAEVSLSAGEARSLSDADGYFRLAGVRPGFRTLLARHLEFERYEEVIEVGLEDLTADVTLVSGWPVSGRVRTEEEAPVAGAGIELRLEAVRGEIRRYHTRSGGDGAFELPRVVGGAYDVFVEAEGHGGLELERAVRVAGEAVAGVELRLPAGARVTGQLLGLELDELAAVGVEALREGRPPRPGTVDYRGRYEIADLAPGVWRLRSATPGGRRQAEGRVAVDPGGGTVEKDLEFVGATLRGTVVYGGEALPAASVALNGHGVAVERSVRTDYAGRFRMTDLAPGHYRLAIAARSHGVTHHQELEILEDRELTIEVATARVEGRVESAGTALADAMVRVHQLLGEDPLPASVLTVATDAEGSFRLARLSAGTYRVEVSKDGFAPAEQLWRLEPAEHHRPSFELFPTEGLDLALRLPVGVAPALAHLSVLDAAGRPVLAETRALDPSGRVRFPTVPAGTWELLVAAPPTAVARITATVPGPPVELHLEPGTRLQVRVPELVEENLMAELDLRAMDGRPFVGVGLGGVPQQRWSLPAGAGQLEGVPPGVWTLGVVSADGRIWQQTVVTGPDTSLEIELE